SRASSFGTATCMGQVVEPIEPRRFRRSTWMQQPRPLCSRLSAHGVASTTSPKKADTFQLGKRGSSWASTLAFGSVTARTEKRGFYDHRPPGPQPALGLRGTGGGRRLYREAAETTAATYDGQPTPAPV